MKEVKEMFTGMKTTLDAIQKSGDAKGPFGLGL